MKSPKPVRTLVSVLERKQVWPPPIWLMRQAGRYLPEYQALRKQSGSFWKMCMTPEIAAEITLQPIRRYDFDAAILFSDILVIPHALGQEVRFEDEIGPVLGEFGGLERLAKDQTLWEERLAPVYQALQATRQALDQNKALIGFAGAPWTLAAYMAGGRGTSDQRAAKLLAYSRPQDFDALLDVLADAVAFHLVRQLQLGADAVQLFDSWAGGLPDAQFERWILRPTAKVVAAVRQAVPDAKIIGFPRAVTQRQYERYATALPIDAIGIDTAASMSWAAESLGSRIAIQGNLDPIAMIAGGASLDAAIDNVLAGGRNAPLIFNLGHGVLPETPLENVARVVERVRSSR